MLPAKRITLIALLCCQWISKIIVSMDTRNATFEKKFLAKLSFDTSLTNEK